MRVFVTGATGFIGSAVVQDLIGAGHRVLGLARSDAAAASLRVAGAEVHRGDLDDPGSLRSGAGAADGVIHTGFIHDFARFKEVCEIDRHAIEALGDALAGSDRPLVVTSVTTLLARGDGRLAEEEGVLAPGANPRVASEETAASAAARGVRVSVVRLPPSVHGDGDHAFVPILIGIARDKGVSAYIGDGRNRWPAVHRLDAAHLFRLALEKAAAGAKLHAVGEEGVSLRTIAEIIGKRLNKPVVSKPAAEAAGHFGWFAHFAAVDNPTSSKQTRERLGWRPTGPTLLTDLESESYFKS